VGSWLVPLLNDVGYRVVGTLRPGERQPGSDSVRWLTCELTDATAVRELVRELQPCGVIHLAAQAVPRDAARTPLDALRSNYLAVHALIEALQGETPGARLLFVSSGEVYGRRAQAAPPARECDPLWPENVYAATKRAAEQRLALAVQAGLDAVCARPFNHTGPGRPDRYAESSFARQIADAERGQQEPCVRVGNLDALRDYSDVRDIVAAYRLLLERGASGATYNVCSGEARSIGSILQELVHQSRTHIEVRVEAARFEPTPPDRAALVGDPQQLRALGWTPRYPLSATLGDLLDFWRSNPAV